jgi:hypothetical protein
LSKGINSFEIPVENKNMSASPSKPLKIFLCHCNEDKPIVSKIHFHLLKTGCDSWLDAGKLLGGQDWNLEIQKAIRSADVFIIFLSRNSIGKEGFIQKEIRMALDIEEEKPEGVIFIIPVILDECRVPHRLTRWQYLNIKQEGFWRKIIDSLNARAVQVGKNPVVFSNAPSIHDQLPKAEAKSKPASEKIHQQTKPPDKKEEDLSFLRFIGTYVISAVCGALAAVMLRLLSDEYYRPGDISLLGIITDYVANSDFIFILLILIAMVGAVWAVYYLDKEGFKKFDVSDRFRFAASALVGLLAGVAVDVVSIIAIVLIIPVVTMLFVIAGAAIYLWVSSLGNSGSISQPSHVNKINLNSELPKNSKITNCAVCNGTGRSNRNCLFCNGTGRASIGNITCSICEGSGKQMCLICDGTGERKH